MKILRERQTWKRKNPPARSTQRLAELSAEEQANVLAAATKLRVQFGSWNAMAAAAGVNKITFYAACAKKAPCAGLALRLAKLAGVPVEHVLDGAFAKPGCCPMCGK